MLAAAAVVVVVVVMVAAVVVVVVVIVAIVAVIDVVGVGSRLISAVACSSSSSPKSIPFIKCAKYERRSLKFTPFARL